MKKNEQGQALITLLVFMVVGIIITTATVTMAIVSLQSTTEMEISGEVLKIAEAGADNAVLRILRNQSYIGETLIVGNGTATITVSGTTTKTIVSEGVEGNLRRKIQVVGTLSNDIFTVTSWSEI